MPRVVLRLALPVVAAGMLQNMFNIVDMYFVGRLGPNAIAAVTASGTLLHLVWVLGMGITTGCTALVAQAVGAGWRERSHRVAGQSLLMALVLSVLVGTLGPPLAARALYAVSHDAHIAATGTPYLQVCMGFSVFTMLMLSFGAAIRGAGDTRTPLIAAAVATVINIVLDPILIFGRFGMPALGVAGSAVATVFAQAVAALWLGWLFFLRGHEHFHLRLGHLVPRLAILWQMFRIGVFGSGQMLVRSISAIVLFRIVAQFGREAQAGFGVGIRLWMAVLIPGIGFGMAASTLVGQNLGAGNPRRAERAGWVTAGIFAVVSAVLTVIFFTLARQLVGFFIESPENHPQVVAIGAQFLRWRSLTFVFLAFAAVLGQAMLGAGDTLRPMIITAVSVLGLALPLAWTLARAFSDPVGVWAALVISGVVQGLLMAGAFRWGKWKVTGQKHLDQAALGMEMAEG